MQTASLKKILAIQGKMLSPPFNPNAAGNLCLVPVLVVSIAVCRDRGGPKVAHTIAWVLVSLAKPSSYYYAK